MSISNQDNTLRGARNLGRLGTRRINGYVGSRDPVDFVKFTLGDVRELSLSIGRIANRASSARITLRDARGAIIRNFRTSPRNITFRDKFPPGTYFIGIQRLRGEVNYRMTAAARPAEPGERLSTARNIGILAGTYTNSEFVGTTDPADIYRFTLNDVANLQARVTGTSANTRVELIRDLNNNGLVDSGEIIASGTNFGAPFLSRVNQDLPQGTYFVRITPSSSNTSTQYRLELVATPFGGSPPPDPGNILATARNLGAVAGTVTAREYVGVLDDLDAYRFTLNDLSNVQVSVQATSANTRIQLVRDINGNGLVDNGEVIVSETNFSSTNLSRFTQDLPAGTYFITVASRNASDSTLYEMNLVATPFGGDGQPDPGNTIPTARNIGVLSNTYSAKEYVGTVDPEDFYRFTLNSTANLQARVQGTSGNTIIELIRDTNGNGLIDSGEIIRSDTNFSDSYLSSFVQNGLAAGTYFFRVRPRPSVSTNYTVDFALV
ncbi:PPC domain-containing protein [Thermoleptolyngbya sp.]